MLILYEVSLELEKAKFSKLNENLLACLVLNLKAQKTGFKFCQIDLGFEKKKPVNFSGSWFGSYRFNTLLFPYTQTTFKSSDGLRKGYVKILEE